MTSVSAMADVDTTVLRPGQNYLNEDLGENTYRTRHDDRICRRIYFLGWHSTDSTHLSQY